jgi:hypothetical protein
LGILVVASVLVPREGQAKPNIGPRLVRVFGLQRRSRQEEGPHAALCLSKNLFFFNTILKSQRPGVFNIESELESTLEDLDIESQVESTFQNLCLSRALLRGGLTNELASPLGGVALV